MDPTERTGVVSFPSFDRVVVEMHHIRPQPTLLRLLTPDKVVHRAVASV